MYKLLYRQIESSLGNWGLGAPRGPKGLGWDPITSLASFGLGVAAARVAQEVWVLSHSGWRFRMDIEWYWVILILKILNSMLFKILGKWSFVKRWKAWDIYGEWNKPSDLVGRWICNQPQKKGIPLQFRLFGLELGTSFWLSCCGWWVTTNRERSTPMLIWEGTW